MPAATLIFAAVLALFGGQASGVRAATKTIRPVDGYLVPQIRHYRQRTWRWQRLMGERRFRTAQSERDASHAYRRWIRDLWKRRARAAQARANRPPHLRAWRCIHRYEGGWRLVDGPYYGGLQMNLEFQRTWGAELLRSKGTADRWTPLEQMWVAERAHRSGLGFTPWPNTARMCGVL
jgi:hypothetical protein